MEAYCHTGLPAVGKIPVYRKLSSEMCQGRHPPNLAQPDHSLMQECLNIDVACPVHARLNHSCYSCLWRYNTLLGTFQFGELFKKKFYHLMSPLFAFITGFVVFWRLLQRKSAGLVFQTSKSSKSYAAFKHMN